MNKAPRSEQRCSADDSQTDDKKPLKSFAKGFGLGILGAAAALPVVCLYLIRHRFQRKSKPVERHRRPESTQGRPEPIRIPVSAVPVNPLTSTREGAAPTDRAAGSKPRYLASTESDRFHLPGCRWAQNINPENRVEFERREEAVARDLTPCGTCQP